MSIFGAKQNRTQRKVREYEIPDQDYFLNKYRYTLVNMIDAEEAIPWLLDHGILDKVDQESIQNGFKTSILKAGDLIDIISRRGPEGLNTLMEFIEYEYPDLFKKMIGKPAQEPDPSVYVPRSKRSMRVSECFRNGIEQLCKTFENSQEFRKKARTTIQMLQDQIEGLETDLNMKQRQILVLSEEILLRNDQNKELAEQLQKAQKERAEAVEKQEILRQEKDKYLLELQSLKQAKMVEENSLSKMPCDEKNPSFQSSEAKLFEENKCLKDQLKKMTDRCLLSEQTVKEYKYQMEQLDKLRRKTLSDFGELRETHAELQQDNNALKEDIICLQRNTQILNNEHLLSNQKPNSVSHLIASLHLTPLVDTEQAHNGREVARKCQE